jgi:chorismate synthase
MIVGNLTITVTDTATKDTLPRRGTKLSITLGALAGVDKGTTRQIADRTGQSSNDTASQLTVLQGRGLVERMNHKRGVEGGSTWMLTILASKLLNI